MYTKSNTNLRIKWEKRELAILAGLTLFAIITRVYGIWEWHYVGDEYYTVYTAAERYKSGLNPAYHTLALGSFKLFGINEWSLRLPAVVLGILSVPIFYITWRSLFGHTTALVGALLIMFSSWHLWHSQWGRFYTGVFLFGSLSYFLYLKAVRSGKWSHLLWTLLANLGAVLFHATAVMVPATCALFSLVVLVSSQHNKWSDYSRQVAAVYLGLCGTLALITLPYFWNIADVWYGIDQTWGYGPFQQALQITKYVQIPIAVSALLGLILLLRQDLPSGIFFSIGIVVPTLALLMGSAFVAIRPDYMFYSLPLILVVAGYLCDQVSRTQLNFRLPAYAITIILIASLMPEWVSHYSGKKSLDIRETVEFVAELYQPGDRVLTFETGFNHYSDHKYAKEQYPGHPYDNAVSWAQELQTYNDSDQRTWIILPVRRTPLAEGLENWLLENTRLVWRKNEKRYDYSVIGYQIFLVDKQYGRSS